MFIGKTEAMHACTIIHISKYIHENFNFSPELLGGGWVGGDQAKGTSFRSRVEFQAGNTQLVPSTGANVSVMALQGSKFSPQKSRPLESGHSRHAVWIAIEYSY